MILINMQYFGNKGSSSGKSGGAGGASKSQAFDQAVVDKNADDFIRHNLSTWEESATFESARVVGPVDENGMAEVEVSYETRVRIQTGWDEELQRPEYEYDTEYHKSRIKIKVK